ncbi:hypothetical protein C0431_12645 [bacterium]|nr:hypothetical protein [bacterium]
MTITLTKNERIELSYLLMLGFKWLVRHEIGSVEVYKIKPHRDKEVNYYPFGKDRGGYNTWIETATPLTLEELSRCKNTSYGKYQFIQWKDEPMDIEALLLMSAEPLRIPVRVTSETSHRVVEGTLSPRQLLDLSDDCDIVEHLTACDCAPVGETYVVECNCDEEFYESIVLIGDEIKEKEQQDALNSKPDVTA